jgi:hypothetical protein
MTDIIECFVSKTVWHSKYTAFFPRIKLYPELLGWLESRPNARDGMGIFGFEKTAYSFSDLKAVMAALDKLDKRAKGKGKRKARDEGDVGKEMKKLKARDEVGKGKKMMMASGSKPLTA